MGRRVAVDADEIEGAGVGCGPMQAQVEHEDRMIHARAIQIVFREISKGRHKDAVEAEYDDPLAGLCISRDVSDVVDEGFGVREFPRVDDFESLGLCLHAEMNVSVDKAWREGASFEIDTENAGI